MAFSLIAHTRLVVSGSTIAGGNTPAIDTTGADLFVIGASMYNVPGHSTITDNYSNIYQSIGGMTHGTEAMGEMQYAKGAGGPGHIFTIANASSFYPSFYVAAFKGSKVSPLDKFSSANVNQPGSITPTVSSALIVSVGAGGPGTTGMACSGFAVVEGTDYANGICEGGALAYLLQSTPTAVNPTWTGLGDPSSLIASFMPGIAPLIMSNAPALLIGI